MYYKIYQFLAFLGKIPTSRVAIRFLSPVEVRVELIVGLRQICNLALLFFEHGTQILKLIRRRTGLWRLTLLKCIRGSTGRWGLIRWLFLLLVLRNYELVR